MPKHCLRRPGDHIISANCTMLAPAAHACYLAGRAASMRHHDYPWLLQTCAPRQGHALCNALPTGAQARGRAQATPGAAPVRRAVAVEVHQVHGLGAREEVCQRHHRQQEHAAHERHLRDTPPRS